MLDMVRKYYFVVIGIIILGVLFIYSINSEESEIVFAPIVNNEVIEEIKYIYIDLKEENIENH